MAVSGRGDDKLGWPLLLDALARLADHRHVLRELGMPAAGQDRDNRLTRIEIVLAAEFFAGLRGLHGADKRMADEFCGDASAAEERFFEWENTESLRETAADNSNTPRPPRPELRADVIDVAHSVRAEFASEPQMKAGKVGEDRKRRFAALGFRYQTAHGANERRKVAKDFRDPDDGDFGIIGDDINASGAHLLSAHAEERNIHAF